MAYTTGRSIATLFGILAWTGLTAVHAHAQHQLVMYCGVDEKWCRAVATAYQKETGVQVDMTRMSAGEVYARVRAEKDNPHGDVWFGGTGDPHLQAADEKITEPYESPMLPKLRDWAQRQAQRSNNRTVGLYLGALGFGYNTEDTRRSPLRMSIAPPPVSNLRAEPLPSLEGNDLSEASAPPLELRSVS